MANSERRAAAGTEAAAGGATAVEPAATAATRAAEAVAVVAAAVAREVDLERMVSTVLDQAVATLGASVAHVYLVTEDGRELQIAGHRNVPADLAVRLARMPVDAPYLAARAASSRQIQIIADAGAVDPELVVAREVLARTGSESLLSVPLLAYGHLVGVLTYALPEARYPSPQELAALRTTAEIFAVGLTNAQAYDRERRLRVQLEAVSRAALAISGAFDLRTVLQSIVDQARVIAEAEFAALGIISGNLEQSFDPWVSSGTTLEQVAAVGRIPCPVGLLGSVPAEGHTIRLRDVAQDPRFCGLPPWHPALVSFLGVPIRYQGRSVGNLYLANKIAGEEFTEADERAVELLAQHAALAVEHARMYEQMAGEIAQRQRAQDERDRLLAREQAAAERFAAVLRGATEDGIIGTDPTGVVTVFNAGAERMLGYRAGEVVGRHTPMLWHDRTEVAARAAELGVAPGFPVFAATATQGEAETREWTFVRKDGSRRTALLTVTALRDRTGELLGFLGVAKDITERQRTEEGRQFLAEAGALLASSLDYATTLRQVANLAVPRLADWCFVHIVAADGALRPLAVAHTDPARVQWFQELRRKHPPEPNAPHGAEQVLGIGRSVLYSEIPESVLWAATRSTEVFAAVWELHPQSAMMVPLMARGRAVGTISFISTRPDRRYDSDDLALAEALALRAALAIDNARLYRETESERRRLSAVLEHVPIGVLIADAPDGRFALWNRAAERLLGHPLTDGRSGDVHFFDVHGQPHPVEDLPLERALLRGETALEAEVVVVRPSGERGTLLVNAAPVLDEDGSIRAAVAVFQDITDRKRAEERLLHAATELARSNAELEQFAYVASHDLQEPLRMVASFTQLLARRYGGKLGPDADEYIRFAVDGATRMRELIQDLLAYSRVGTRGGDFVTVDCGEVLDRVLVSLGPAMQEAGAVITRDDLPVLAADASQVGQLFQNLLSNAIKFHGAEPPVAHVSAERLDQAWRFSVRDSGIGIAPEYGDRIFIIFQRLHSREQYPGTGIGLAICKKIVERHGGRIWVESQPGRGATFCFTIPDRW